MKIICASIQASLRIGIIHMAKFNCFSLLTTNKKKDKGVDASSKAGEDKRAVRTVQIKLEQPVQHFEGDGLKSTTFIVPVPVGFQEDSLCDIKLISHESPVEYEGEDEHEDNASIKEFSDFDLQAHVANSGEEFDFRTKGVASLASFENEAKHRGGCSSDTIEPHQARKLGKKESPGSFGGESLIKDFTSNCNDTQRLNGFHERVSGLWLQNQWVAFPAPSSSLTRVCEWMRDLETLVRQPADGVNSEKGITFPPSPHTGKSPARSIAPLTCRSDINLSEEILYANSFIQSPNSSTTAAHISGIGFTVIPIVSARITPGSLPKGLQTLNLSRNNINTIEGLRELTRFTLVFMMQGLSSCALMKELYLAGNKISDVEGLYRLLKLTILDLGFNKITTTKAIGQLVANYNSLQALNLLRNPIQSNISYDQLRKAVCSLLPKITYLNKKLIKPQRARKVLTNRVAKAALGSDSWSCRRKAPKRASQGGSTSSIVHISSVAIRQNKNKSKSQSRHHLSVKSPAPASSSH
ncbi:hypothetical protein DITRI_Ditri03aG0164600 [Diplodiscus trichospermus]